MNCPICQQVLCTSEDCRQELASQREQARRDEDREELEEYVSWFEENGYDMLLDD